MAKDHMNAALLLTLILTVMSSGLSLSAQDQAATGRLAGVVTDEAVRLAAAHLPSSSIETSQHGGTAVTSNWAGVRQLAFGTELIVTVTGAPSVHGTFQSADDSELTVFDLDRRQTEHIARTDVVEISVLKKPSPKSASRWGALIGLGAGLATAGFVLHSYCSDHTCDTAPAVAVSFYSTMGALIGSGIGVLVGIGRDKTRTVIYRAP